MAVEATQFQAEFPEFAEASPGELDAAIASAARQTGTVFGDDQDRATMLMVAHLLTIGVLTSSAKDKPNAEGTTIYYQERQRLARRYVFALGVSCR